MLLKSDSERTSLLERVRELEREVEVSKIKGERYGEMVGEEWASNFIHN
jgi:hypothetical protein